VIKASNHTHETECTGGCVVVGLLAPVKSGTKYKAIERLKATLFVNTWQGAIVVAHAGEGLEHIAESSAISKRSSLSPANPGMLVEERFVVQL
jgi:hypothetical protein